MNVESKNPLQPLERTFYWLLLIFSVAVIYQAFSIAGFEIANSSGSLPMGAGLALGISSLVILIGSYRRQPPELSGLLDQIRAFRRVNLPADVLVFSTLCIVYVVAMYYLGFYPCTLVFLACSMIYLMRGRVFYALLIAGGSLLFIYALFSLVFHVYLP
ncbi:tripartite tricarboxylate transporter TctB family protein [Pseudomonas sp. NPDC078700]|uniref:tripartite tricarboxylate transporter TctB family protein n=1 Tax=Pseudomonas sp. NPDC078700 TaxID=3364424 RepID=UPI0037C71CEC